MAQPFQNPLPGQSQCSEWALPTRTFIILFQSLLLQWGQKALPEQQKTQARGGSTHQFVSLTTTLSPAFCFTVETPELLVGSALFSACFLVISPNAFRRQSPWTSPPHGTAFYSGLPPCTIHRWATPGAVVQSEWLRWWSREELPGWSLSWPTVGMLIPDNRKEARLI